MGPLLSLVGLQKRYRRGQREIVVLDDVSFALRAFDFACLLGERSSGKTTLLEIAAGLRPPDFGQVRYGGRDLATLGERARGHLRRSEIACVWNRKLPAIHAVTVLDHVALPLVSSGIGRRQRRTAAAEMLERVGALDYAQVAVDALSDGESTRVALAQACVRRPRLLIADELTDTLDMAERNEVLGVLQGFARDGVAILLSAASAHGAAGCNRLLSLSGGRLIEPDAAPPGDVIAFPTRSRGSDGVR